MNKITSTTISVIFQPSLVNLLNLFGLFYLFPELNIGMPSKLKWFYFLFIFISTSVIPIILVVVMKLSGKVDSIMLQNKEERRIPYLLTIFIYGFDYYNFTKISAHPLILNYLLASILILTLVFVINNFYKISIHTATLGSFLALLVVNSFYTGTDMRLLIAFTIIIIGLVASARIFALSHNNAQVYLGLAVGFIPMYFIL